jgi:protein-tyrosine phosphatase
MQIDFHAHVLPGADHGSDCMETSRTQLTRAREAKIGITVATPHFYPESDSMGDFLARRRAACRRLQAGGMQEYPAVAVGAEAHLCAGMEHMEELDALCIRGTRTILLELPFHNWSDAVFETVLAIQHSRKFTPVLAHVDRYDPEIINELFSCGIRGQLNADGLCRIVRRRQLLRWIDRGCIYALGSDIHGEGDRYAHFRKAQELIGSDAGEIMRRAGELLRGAEFLNPQPGLLPPQSAPAVPLRFTGELR